jgi:peptidyl-tRNA hydrolase, PTH1 family
MKMIIGLGNPGEKYQATRHNIGFMVLDALADRLQAHFELDKKHQAEVAKGGSDIWLVKPQTFMNASGAAIRSLIQFYKLDQDPHIWQNLLVVHDDLDLETGRYKLQLGTGPKIHNGLLSLYQELGTKDFWHVRVGVDGRMGDRRLPGQDYVLQPFLGEEQEAINQAISEVVQRLELEVKG